jgi:hypothetical protein
MNEHAPSHELPPTANELSDVFESVTAHQRDRSTNPLTAGYHTIAKNAILDTLIESGVDPDDAARHVEITEEDPMAGRAMDRDLLELSQSDVLSRSGLGLSPDPRSPRVQVIDAHQFCKTLDQTTADPTERTRLAGNLDSFFGNVIRDAQTDLVLYRPGDVQRVLGDSFDTHEAEETDDPLFDNSLPGDKQVSLREVLDNASLLANSYRDLGGNTETADTLESLGAYDEDGDLMHWAAAGRLGLLPETEHLYEGHEWHSWNTPEQWSPAFRLLETANPIGRFGSHLEQSLLALLNRDIDETRAGLEEDLPTYIEQARAHEAENEETPIDFDGESIDFSPSDNDLAIEFEGQQDYLKQRLTTLQAVQQQFTHGKGQENHSA